jgi:hypothetical protein
MAGFEFILRKLTPANSREKQKEIYESAVLNC